MFCVNVKVNHSNNFCHVFKGIDTKYGPVIVYNSNF